MNEEYKHCLEDPVYFIEHYCYIKYKDKTLPIKLHDYQKELVYDLLHKYR